MCPLVVVHAHRHVVPAAVHLGEDRVGRDGADGVDATRLGDLDGGRDLLDLLAAKEAVLATVRVEAGHGHARVLDA